MQIARILMTCTTIMMIVSSHMSKVGSLDDSPLLEKYIWHIRAGVTKMRLPKTQMTSVFFPHVVWIRRTFSTIMAMRAMSVIMFTVEK